MKNKLIILMVKHLLVGSNLTKSIEDVIKTSKKGKFPKEEQLAALLSALIKRLTRFWFIPVILAATPCYLLYNQNNLIKQQTEFFKTQFAYDSRMLNSQILFDKTGNPIMKELALTNFIRSLADHEKTNIINFRNVKLDNTKLVNKKFENFDFSYSSLNEIDASSATFTNVLFNKSKIICSKFVGTKFNDCNFEDAILGIENSLINEMTGEINELGQELYLQKGNYRNTIFNNCVFNRINLRNCDMSGATFNNLIWESNTIIPQNVEGAIFIGVKGLNSKILERLQKSNAIINKTDLIIKIEKIEEELKSSSFSDLTRLRKTSTLNYYYQIISENK